MKNLNTRHARPKKTVYYNRKGKTRKTETSTNKPTQHRKKVEELEAGKINFEQVLQSDLQQANNLHRQGRITEFYLAIQTIWDNCLEGDREEIMKLVKERYEEQGKTHKYTIKNPEEEGIKTRRMTRPLNQDRFLELVEADPNYATGRVELRENNLSEWREVFAIINQGLKLRYHGKKREYERDKLTA